MNIPIQIPAMGESIIEVKMGNLLKPAGTLVALDEEIGEIETDKVNQVLNAPASGILHWTHKTGDTVKIGESVGFIEPKEAPTKTLSSPPPPVKTASPVIPSSNPIRISIDEALQSTPPLPPQKPAVEKLPSSSRETRKKMSNLRKIIAEKLVEAKNSTALLTTFNEVDMSAIIALREKEQESFQKKHGVKLGFMSFFIKASVAALQEFPAINARIDGDEIVYHHFFNIGVAVSTEKGLMVPVLKDADQKSYAELEKELKMFSDKARSGQIAISDLQGGTFTITNGGVFGSLISTPILNPPQSGILGMHNIVKRPIAIDNTVQIRPMMYIALSYDHRIVDGRESILFLMSIKKNLEEPSRLMLDL